MKKFILTLFFCSLTTICFSQEALQKIRINDFSGGMVSNAVADKLQANQAASMLNVDLHKQGKIIKRKGNALFNVDVSNTPHTGIGRFDPGVNTSYIMIASGTTIARSTAAATFWTLANPNSSPQTAALDTEFIQANNLLFVINGYDSTAWYDGANWTKGNSWPASPPTATTGAWLRNYLFLAGATNNNDWVYVSTNLQPTVFAATDIIKINTGDGQKVERLVPYRLNELIVYKERSIFDMDITGSPPSTCTDDCWTVQPISTVIGTPAPRSVVSLGNDQWFLSSEPIAIRTLQRTSFDKILVDYVSVPIQDIFDGTNDFGYNLNKAQVSKSAAVLFDNKYILAIPSGTSTVNNLVIVYDFLYKAWYLITGWYPSDWVVFNNRLFYTDANDGRVLEAFSGTDGDYLPGAYQIPTGSTPTVGINFQYISKAFDFDASENFKQSDALEVEFNPTGNWTANVQINLDNQGWTSVGSVSLAATHNNLPVTLPITLGNSGLDRKTFQTQKYGEFKKMQFKVEQSASQQTVELQRATLFAVPKQWRRE